MTGIPTERRHPMPFGAELLEANQDSCLDRLAERMGIRPEFRNAHGQTVRTTPETQCRLLRAMGLDVHDAGTYGQPLKENMVITVEPGIYIPAGSPCDKKWWDIGVRIEDDVRIGKDKEELLSWQAPRKAEDVEKMRNQKSAINDWVLPTLP